MTHAVPITVTQGEIAGGYLRASALVCVCDFFPADTAVGGEIEIEIDGFGDTLVGLNGRTRDRFYTTGILGGRFFADREFPRLFYNKFRTRPGDRLFIEKLGDRKFRLRRPRSVALVQMNCGMPVRRVPVTPTVAAEVAAVMAIIEATRPVPLAPDPLPCGDGLRFAQRGLTFRLERHLEEFLAHNWNLIPEFSGWRLLGTQVRSATGPIDMLATNDAGEYLVVELKRDKTSDQTVGQICRYMSWVEDHYAKGHAVKGMIVAIEQDESIRYAVRRVRDVSLVVYELAFRLHAAT